MALKRWRWVLGPVFAAALVMVVALPPRTPAFQSFIASFFGQGYDEGVPVHPGADAVARAVYAQRWELSEQELADSLARVARSPRALRSADGAVTVVYGRPFTSDSARVWLEAAAAELALYPETGRSRIPVVVALFIGSARRDDARVSYRFDQPVVGLLEATMSSGACVVVLNLAGVRPNWFARGLLAHNAAGRALGRFLGSCALYGRYGVPGTAVAKWAEAGYSWYYWDNLDGLSRRLQEAQRAIRRDTIDAAWSYSNFWQGGVLWAPIACLRGGTSTCTRIAGLSSMRYDSYWWSNRVTPSETLAWLLTSGTPRQFTAFWQSSLPPAQAIEAAYGKPAGQVVLEAYRHWTSPPEPGGPRASPRVVVVGMGWAVVALALAIMVGRRWQTER